MNVSSLVLLSCLKRNFYKTPCLSQLFTVQRIPLRSICLSQCHNVVLNKRSLEGNESILKKAWKKIKFYAFEKSIIKISSYFLYETIADKIDYMYFFEEMKLPDTFNSWFVVTELHMWMLMVKAIEFGQDGRTISYYMVEAMWGDVTEKGKKLGSEHRSVALGQIRELGDQFHAALLAYDEGLLTNDKVLASALWRRFFGMDCDDPKRVERMVKYVRRQMQHMDLLTEEQFRERQIKWIPLKEIKLENVTI